MTYDTRIQTRIQAIALVVALGFVSLVSMAQCATDSDIDVPSRIWVGPAVEASP